MGLFGTVSAALFESAQERADATEAREAIVRERLHGRVGEGWFCHDEDTGTMRVHVVNGGQVELDLSRVTFVVDGAVLAGFNAEPQDAAGSALWPPGDEAEFQRTGVAAEPDRLVLVTERGVTFYPEKRETC